MELIIGGADPIEKILWNEARAPRATAGGTFVTSELPTGTLWLLKGTPCKLNYATGAINAVKSAKVITGGTTTIPRVGKNHLFKVGDFVFKSVDGLAVTINAIDTTTSADYDVVTLSAAFTGLVADDILMQSVAAGATAGALKYKPNGLLGNNKKIDASPLITPIIGALEIETANLPFNIASLFITELNIQQTFMFV